VSWWRLELAPYGERRALVAVTNVTQAKAHERSLRASERLNRSILSGLQEGVVVVDTNSRIVLANAAAAHLFGADELVGRSLTGVPVDLLDDRGRLLADEKLPLARALRGEETRGEVVRFVRSDGSLLWVEVHANPLVDDDGRIYGAVASYDDATVRVERDRRTRHEADHDPLTGLANRRALERTLEAALARAASRGRSVGVLMLDLDGFKAVNDRHGHAAGDEVLREVARRLRRSVRERDLVARLGGDEFVVVLTDLGAVPDSVDRVEAALAERFPGTGGPLRAAAGVAVFPADGATVADLLAVADREMYAAKASRSLR
jgi:diguanylate cyclase (GGDEF)-like protein/PAS domain S-box-containing protein